MLLPTEVNRACRRPTERSPGCTLVVAGPVTSEEALGRDVCRLELSLRPAGRTGGTVRSSGCVPPEGGARPVCLFRSEEHGDTGVVIASRRLRLQRLALDPDSASTTGRRVQRTPLAGRGQGPPAPSGEPERAVVSLVPLSLRYVPIGTSSGGGARRGKGGRS